MGRIGAKMSWTDLKAQLLVPAHNELGEGPVWDDQKHELLWLDIKRCCIWAYHHLTGGRIVIDLGQNIGSMAQRTAGGMILAMTTGIFLIDAGGDLQKLPDPVISPRARFNDGKCDPRGRFWAGTMNLFPGENHLGSLYCILPDRRAKCLLSGVSISNGLAFSADMSACFYIDTPSGKIDAFDIIELPDGFPDLINRRTIINVDVNHLGYPDGMTIDDQGFLWVAHWGSGVIGRYDPVSGEISGKVSIPVKAATSCCFGGSGRRTLYITSSREGMSPDEEINAGNLFSVHLPVAGAPSYRFGG